MAAATNAEVVCANVIVDGDAVLFVRESKPAAFGRWSLPAGRLETGESLEAGAAREALEETGLEVEVGRLLGIYHCAETLEGGSVISFVFESNVISGALRTASSHSDARYLSPEEIEALYAERMIRGQHVRLALDALAAGVEVPRDVVTAVSAALPPIQR